MSSISDNIQRLRKQIHLLEEKYNRETGIVQLLAVSKTHDTGKIAEAWAVEQKDFAENHLQEALNKINELADRSICWHFIGPVQSNKTRAIAEYFDWVHSVDRFKIAKRLSEQRPDARQALNILLQINTSKESSKSGLDAANLKELAKRVIDLHGIRLRGLMAIPAPESSFLKQRESFRILADAFHELKSTIAPNLDQLSMGMSRDYEAAIAEGSTMIRIGTAIFGKREALG